MSDYSIDSDFVGHVVAPRHLSKPTLLVELESSNEAQELRLLRRLAGRIKMSIPCAPRFLLSGTRQPLSLKREL
jgi:hypothetical protein